MLNKDLKAFKKEYVKWCFRIVQTRLQHTTSNENVLYECQQIPWRHTYSKKHWET